MPKTETQGRKADKATTRMEIAEIRWGRWEPRHRLTHPDTVTVCAQIGEVGDDRFVMRYRAVSHRDGAVPPDGESLVVTFDYATGSKARVSDDLAARLMDLCKV